MQAKLSKTILIQKNFIYLVILLCGVFITSSTFAQVTITSVVSNGNDDSEERLSDGAIDITSSDLELIDDNGLHENQLVGIRFNNINIPNGAFITNAFLTFECDEADGGATDLLIRAHASDNAPALTTVAFNLTSRPATAASVSWLGLPSWSIDTDYNSPSIASVIQEIVNRPGWVGNNSIVILISGSGERTAESYNGEAAAAPILTITYCLGGIIGDPVFTLGSSSQRCQGSGNMTYTATSSLSTSISYSLDANSLAFGNMINPSTGEVSYVAGWSGTSAVTTTALGCGGPKTATHTVTTLPSAPTVSFPITLIPGRCIGESSESYTIEPILVTDVVYSLDPLSIAGGLTVNDSMGTVFFPLSWSGNTIVTATATSTCGSNSENFVVITSEVVAIDDNGFGGADESIVINTIANDICDTDATTVTITSGPSNGTLIIGANGVITYTPNLGFSGTDSYTYEVCGLVSPLICDEAEVFLEVSPFFADDYFNSPTSNCEYSPQPESYAMAAQYEIPTPIALYANSQVGDIDGDGVIEILSLSATDIDINNPRRSRNLCIFNGTDGTLETTITTPFLSFDGGTPFAIADLDDDGDAEIIVAAMDDMGGAYNNGFERRLVCYDHAGTQLWVSNAQFGVNHHNGTDQAGTPTVGIADFNQDGTPEVYVYNEIFNALTGVKLCDGGANGVGNQHDYRNQQPGITVAADLRPSAGLELAAGPTVYDVTITNTLGTAGNTMVANNFTGVAGTLQQRDGFTAIADINLDGVGDVIVMSQNDNVYAYNPVTMNLIAQRTSAASSRQGALFIGDVDGDGSPNIGYCREDAIDMLSYNGTATFQLKWTLVVVDGSARTNLTMFDFNQDGTQEIVYRDETTLRIFDGSGVAPSVLVSLPSFSDTAMEGPVVADVDNDGNAEILVTTEDSAADTDRVGKLQVFSSNAAPWAPARKVWNQYAYYNTHINDNLTIPTVMPRHWEAFFSLPTTCPLTFQERPLNSFNVQSTYYSNEGCPEFPSPDAALSSIYAYADCATNTATINYVIRNLADDVQIPANTSVSFYLGNPMNGPATLLSTQNYGSAIPPLSSSTVQTFTQAGFSPGSTIFAVVGDDGSDPVPISHPVTSMQECNYANNILSLNVNCFIALGAEWAYFEAIKDDNKSLLTWGTFSERDLDFFILQRSDDGLNFESFAMVEAVGTSSETQQYQTHDYSPLDGMNYYRILTTDTDGQVETSEIRAINFLHNGLVVFPNPGNNLINIYSPFKNCTLLFRDMAGRLIHSDSAVKGLNLKDVEFLSSGMYMINVLNQNGELLGQQKFIKK